MAPHEPDTERGDARRRIGRLAPWFHNMRLAGAQTAPDHPLGDYPANHWRHFAHALPGDLAGKSVLDIGCNAGFYAIEMKRRGASRVLAIDSDERYLAQARLAAELNDVEIEFARMSVYEIGALAETFDLVLLMGVLYHLRNPLLALDLTRRYVVRDLLVFHSLTRGGERAMRTEVNYPFAERDIFFRADFPKLHFIEHSYADDPTNWWAPNTACTEAMLRASGFEILAHPDSVVYVCRARPGWRMDGEEGALLDALKARHSGEIRPEQSEDRI